MALAAVAAGLCCLIGGLLLASPGSFAKGFWEGAGGTLAIAGSLAKKKRLAVTAGTLSTTNGMFVFLLIFVVLLVGALSFFPALSLGPIAEYTQMLGLG